MSVVDLAQRIRLSDPKPDYCSSCLTGADAGMEFVDMQSAHDGGSVVMEDGLTVVGSLDDLHLCKACVQEAANVLGTKPETAARLLRERDEARHSANYWKDYARDLEQALAKRPIEVKTRRGGSR